MVCAMFLEREVSQSEEVLTLCFGITPINWEHVNLEKELTNVNVSAVHVYTSINYTYTRVVYKHNKPHTTQHACM